MNHLQLQNKIKPEEFHSNKAIKTSKDECSFVSLKMIAIFNTLISNLRVIDQIFFTNPDVLVVGSALVAKKKYC